MTLRSDNANSTSDRRRRWRAGIVSPGPLVSTLAWIHGWGNDALWVLAAVSALLFLYGAVSVSPNARLIVAQQQQDAVERESRAFCEKHGIPFGTREHALCTADLADIRANEHRRTLDELRIF